MSQGLRQAGMIVLGERFARDKDDAAVVCACNGHFAEKRWNRIHVKGHQSPVAARGLGQDLIIGPIDEETMGVLMDARNLLGRCQLFDETDHPRPDVLIKQEFQARAISRCSICGKPR